MTNTEFIESLLEEKRRVVISKEIDVEATMEVAQLISGSFTYLLFEALWVHHFDISVISEHLEDLYETDNHFGLVYLITMFANAVNCSIPQQFIEMSVNDKSVPFLSAAIIDDWFNYEFSCEINEFI